MATYIKRLKDGQNNTIVPITSSDVVKISGEGDLTTKLNAIVQAIVYIASIMGYTISFSYNSTNNSYDVTPRLNSTSN